MTLSPVFAIDSAPLRKARGAFFTPDAIADFVTKWAVRDASDSVMEPSCGEAAFLTAAVSRLRELGAEIPHVAGVEIHEASAQTARDIVVAAGGIPDITTADFFTVAPQPKFTAAIGNPPYIRYQDFSGQARLRSREAALQAGVPISGLASSWAAFTVHTALFLKPGGRMGLVVPAELLSVNYAAVIRSFLMERFATVDLVLFTERVFPGVQEDVVLVLADGFGEGPTDHISIYQAQDAADLLDLGAGSIWRPETTDAKWTASVLPPGTRTTFAEVLAGGDFTALQTWGETTLGMVTGNNNFFALSPARAKELKLEPADTIRLSPPGSRHLRGLALTKHGMGKLAEDGQRTLLFRPQGDPSPAAAAYIEAGHTTGVDTAYKCRVRTPWWRVPLVKPADLLLTCMNADTPRIVTNSTNVHHLNSVHGVYVKPELRELARELLPLAALNSVTVLAAETVGRAYGGGMLKMEPREADRWPMPSPELVEGARDALLAVRGQVAVRLRAGKLLDAVALVDEALLVGAAGMDAQTVKEFAKARAFLASRRAARSGG